MPTTPTGQHTAHVLGLTASLKLAALHTADLLMQPTNPSDQQDAAAYAHLDRARQAILTAAEATEQYALALQAILTQTDRQDSQEPHREDRQPPHHPSQSLPVTTRSIATD